MQYLQTEGWFEDEPDNIVTTVVEDVAQSFYDKVVE